MTIGKELAREAYPDHPFIIAVQQDGLGGKVHIHLLSPNCSIKGLGFSDEQTRHSYLKAHVDRICSRHFELDNVRSRDRSTRSEKTKRVMNELNAKYNEEVRAKNETIKKQNLTLPPDKQIPLLKERTIEYLWRDDLKSRIIASMQNAISRDQFLEELTRHGVEGQYRSTRKNGNFILYELTDLTSFAGEPPRSTYFRCKSYKLGSDYNLGALDRHIMENTTRINETATVELQDDSGDTPRGVAGYRHHRDEAKRRAAESARKRESAEKDDHEIKDETNDLLHQAMINAIQDDLEQLEGYT